MEWKLIKLRYAANCLANQQWLIQPANENLWIERAMNSWERWWWWTSTNWRDSVAYLFVIVVALFSLALSDVSRLIKHDDWWFDRLLLSQAPFYPLHSHSLCYLFQDDKHCRTTRAYCFLDLLMPRDRSCHCFTRINKNIKTQRGVNKFYFPFKNLFNILFFPRKQFHSSLLNFALGFTSQWEYYALMYVSCLHFMISVAVDEDKFFMSLQ